MSKKKVTAPLSYDPGKGRPKEYLAYLNWQEMQALRRLNGNNMERGPKGLPSFPPDDSLNSGQTPGTGNWTGAPGGTSYGGAGGTSGGGSDSGNLGGAAGSTASSTAGSAASAQASQSADTAAQESAAARNTAEAARNAAFRQDAAKGGIGTLDASAERPETTFGGGQISGAIGRVAQGAPVAPVTQSSLGATGYYHTLQDSLPGMGAPNTFSTVRSPLNAVNEYGNPQESWSGAYDANKLTPGAQKIHQAIVDESLRTGIPVDFFSGQAFRSGTKQHPMGQAIDIRINDPITGKPVGYDQIGGLASNPIASVRKDKMTGDWIRTPQQAAKIESALAGPYRDFAAGVMSSFYSNPGVYGEFGNQRWGGAFRGGEFEKDYMHFDEGKVSSGVNKEQARLRQDAIAMAASPSSYSSIQSAGYTPTVSSTSPAATNLAKVENSYNPGVIPDPAATAVMAGIANLPGALSKIKIPSIPEPNFVEKGFRMAKQKSDPAEFQKMVDKAMADATSGFSLADTVSSGIKSIQAGLATATPTTSVASGTPAAAQQLASVEDQYRAQPTPVKVAPGEGYYMKPDGTPFTAADIKNLPPDVYKEYMDKERWKRETDEPYPLTTDQKIKIGAVKGVTAPIKYNPLTSIFTGATKAIGWAGSKLPGAVGEDFAGLYDAADALRDPGAAMAAYERANPLEKARMLANAGQSPTYGAGTSFAGGTPVQELGGKSYQDYGGSFGGESTNVAYNSAGVEPASTDRPSQYYLWDLGVGIPSPGDPDYNEYRKYRKLHGSSTDV